MSHLLVVYATTEGHTRKIAARVAERVRAAGHSVTLVDAGAAERLELGPFDGAILAASLHVGQHQREIRDFIHKQRCRLEAVPTAFISVSLSGGSLLAEDRRNAQGALEAMFEELDWQATAAHLAGGAVQDGRMGLFKRWIIHRILRRKGVEMDPSGYMEFTDWPALDRFVARFLHDNLHQARDGA